MKANKLLYHWFRTIPWSYLIAYVVIVLLFAIFNWILFLHNSTAFVISDQMNKHLERYDFLNGEIAIASYHRDAKDEMPITIDGFSKMVSPLFAALDSLNGQLNNTRNQIDNCIYEQDSLLLIADKAREKAIFEFKTKELSIPQSRIDSLSQYMNGKDSIEMVIQGKYVEMAQLQLEYAKMNYDVCSYVVDHFGSFASDSISRRIMDVGNTWKNLSFVNSRLEDERMEVSNEIRQKSSLFHQHRMKTIGLCDFLYYSICVSTTVSFGDIGPNNGLTRFLAVLEIVLCLVLVGLIIGTILDGLKKKSE